MQAATLETTGVIVVGEVDDLIVGADQVLIRVAYAGVCGSDVHSFEGTHPFRHPPVVLGHEVSGTVEALGPEAKGLAIGDRVTVMPFVACGVCSTCQRGLTHICESKEVPGIKGWVGTFADYFLAKDSITYRLGENTSLKRGLLAEPLAVGVHSVRRARVKPGESVLVLGAGTIGMLTAIAADSAGAAQVVVTDLYEYNLDLATSMGYGAYNARDPQMVAAIQMAYPEGFDAVFLTGSAAITMVQGTALAKRRGRIVTTSIFPKPVPMTFSEVNLHELELLGTSIYDHDDFMTTLELLEANQSPFDDLVDHVFPLAQAQEAVELVAHRREPAIKVALRP